MENISYESRTSLSPLSEGLYLVHHTKINSTVQTGIREDFAEMALATAISEHNDDDRQQQQRQLPSLFPPEGRISHVSNDMLRRQIGYRVTAGAQESQP